MARKGDKKGWIIPTSKNFSYGMANIITVSEHFDRPLGL